MGEMERWQHTLPVSTTEISVAVPGAYRITTNAETGVSRYSPVIVDAAPAASVPETKRAAVIDGQHSTLDEQTLVLEESTKLRNRELRTHLDAIETRGRRWEAKLRVEVEEAKAAHLGLLARFNEALAFAVASDEGALMAVMEQFHGETLPSQEQRASQSESDVRVFVTETVPTVIDRQSGIVARKLRKAHDTFDIENAKILKREQKITARFDRHATRTAQSFEDERATRRAKFTLLAEEIADNERTDDRAEERDVAAAHTSIAHLKAQLQNESAVREKEDNTLLDSMIYSQRKLQASVLKAFGAEAEKA